MTTAAAQETGETLRSVFENAAHTRRVRYSGTDRIGPTDNTIRARPIATIIVAATMGVAFGAVLGWTHAILRHASSYTGSE